MAEALSQVPLEARVGDEDDLLLYGVTAHSKSAGLDGLRILADQHYFCYCSCSTRRKNETDFGDRDVADSEWGSGSHALGFDFGSGCIAAGCTEG